MSLVNKMANLAIRAKVAAKLPTRSNLSVGNNVASVSFQNASVGAPSSSVVQGMNLRSISQMTNTGFMSTTYSQQRNQSTAATQPASSPLVEATMLEDGTVIATGPDGAKYAIPLKPLGNYSHKRHAPKIAPHIVKARTSQLKTMPGAAKNIRHSPWRLNLICQFAAGQTVNDALLQLQYVNKVKAPLVYNLIQGTANSAKTKYDLLPSELEIVECFATHGTHLKRIKTMGRGRAGKMHRRFSHMRVVLRQIDFPLKIMQSTTINERQQWVKKMEVAMEEKAAYLEEKREIEELEREAEAMKQKKLEEENK